MSKPFLPAGWECERYYLTGNGQLCATYTNGDFSVVVSPYKSYSGAGFPDSHKVRVEGLEDGAKVVAKGLNRCEFVEEADKLALETARSLEYNGDIREVKK